VWEPRLDNVDPIDARGLKTYPCLSPTHLLRGRDPTPAIHVFEAKLVAIAYVTTDTTCVFCQVLEFFV
jgi:hypothetical protein